jgi:hypothetical protein
MAEERKTFSAEVCSVFSGDDLVLLIDLGLEDLYKKKRVRLDGVDTPSAINQGPDTEAGKVRTYVHDLLKRKKLKFTITANAANSWIGVLTVQCPAGPIVLNEVLIAQGYKFNREKGIK